MYKPSTVRCVLHNVLRYQPYTILGDEADITPVSPGIRCYADIQVAAYIIGTGPAGLTVLAAESRYTTEGMTPTQIEEFRKTSEQALSEGIGSSHYIYRGVDGQGIIGVESILFLGPDEDASVETWRVYTVWDLDRRDDGTVIAVHPGSDYWLWKDADKYRSQVEWSVPAFTAAVQAAHQARLVDYGGRIGGDEDMPHLVVDANNLRAFHVETGNVNHPDGPPVQPPPVPER